jgi:hypothetical protein
MLSKEWHVSEAFDVRINRTAQTRSESRYAKPVHTLHAVAGRPTTSPPSTTA